MRNNISCLICHVQYNFLSNNNNNYTELTPFLTNCCNRWICESCLKRNPNFLNYCIFCQKVERFLSGNRDQVEETNNNNNIDSPINDDSSFPPPPYMDSLDVKGNSQPPKY